MNQHLLKILHSEKGHQRSEYKLDCLKSNKVSKDTNRIYGIPMENICAPLNSDLFVYAYELQFMTKINKEPSEQNLI